MTIDSAYAQPVEITDGLTMLQCEECRYMAGPGYDPSLETHDQDQEDTLSAFQYHDCEAEKADAQWYYDDL